MVRADDLDDLLELTEARRLDAHALIAQLAFMTTKTHAFDHRKPMDENEKLLDEAFWYAKHGDIDEANYRLSMLDHTAVDDDEDDWEDEE